MWNFVLFARRKITDARLFVLFFFFLCLCVILFLCEGDRTEPMVLLVRERTRSNGYYSSSSQFCDQTDWRAIRFLLPAMFLFQQGHFDQHSWKVKYHTSGDDTTLQVHPEILHGGILRGQTFNWDTEQTFHETTFHWDMVGRISGKNFLWRENFRYVLKNS